MGVMRIPGHEHQKPREVSLDEIRAVMGNCQLCPLGSTRTNLVFGVGNPRARVMFVGEGPGRNEDLRGEPFVGAAGHKLDALLAEQSPDDLLWIREGFWGSHTGLVDAEGKGPIVIAGHTPTPYLDRLCADLNEPLRDEDGRAKMLRVGADQTTGGVADRWDIDAGAAGGAGFGRVGIMRLDDGAEFYEDISEDE